MYHEPPVQISVQAFCLILFSMCDVSSFYLLHYLYILSTVKILFYFILFFLSPNKRSNAEPFHLMLCVPNSTFSSSF